MDVALALKGLRAEEQFVDDDAEFDRLGRDVVGSNAEAMTKL